MNTRALVVPMLLLASCGDAASDHHDASVDGAAGSVDAPEPSYDVSVDGFAGPLDSQDEGHRVLDARYLDGSAGSGCVFRDTSGLATITEIDPIAGNDCYGVVTFDFVAGSGAMDAGALVDAAAPFTKTGLHMTISPPCGYLQAMGIVVGAVLPAVRHDIIAGACPTPVYAFPGIDYTTYYGR
jgi:hypothetical protein